MDAGPDRESVQFTSNLYDAGVLVGLGYRIHSTYSVPGDWVKMCVRVLYYLQPFDVGIRYNK